MTTRRYIWALSAALALSSTQARSVGREAVRVVERGNELRAHTDSRSLLSDVYGKLARSQDHGEYAEALRGLRDDPKTAALLNGDLVQEVEELRALSPAERQRQLQDLFSYYSETGGGRFKSNALNLEARISYKMPQLVAGDFESARLASDLLAAVGDYQRRVMLPILEQVQTELVRDFRSSELLFLGRDFTPGYLWMTSQGQLPSDHLHLANVSRAVKEAALAGRLNELDQLLHQAGLDAHSAIDKGLVIIDSGVLGKVPAAVLMALCQGLTPSERFQLLTKTQVRYLRSGRVQGPSVAAVTAQVAQATHQINDAQLGQILAQLQGIPEFTFSVPAEVAKYRTRQHNLFEHRPKVMSKLTGLATEGGEVRTVSEEPELPSLRINSLLGLHADMLLLDRPERQGGVTPLQAQPKVEERTSRAAAPRDPAVEAAFAEINALKGDRVTMDRWQDTVTPSALASFGRMRVVPLANGHAELWVDNQKVFDLTEKLGEGRNIVAYKTSRGTAVKVVKKAKSGRKQLLLAWADGVMTDYGLDHARVIGVHPQGLYLEQELVPGGSLESRYGAGGQPLPPAIQKQVLDQWERAKLLAKERGIWLDIKSANFGLGADGRVVNVDYVPRLNASYFRYFRDDRGTDFTSEKFIDEFLHHDLRKKAAKVGAPG